MELMTIIYEFLKHNGIMSSFLDEEYILEKNKNKLKGTKKTRKISRRSII